MATAEDSRFRFALWAFLAWLAVTIGWWALAFAPLADPPVWLARARAVCFGTLPNGLPDTYGWVGLVLSPASMLGVLLAVWGRELGTHLRRLGASRAGRLALAAIVLVPLAGALGVGQQVARGLEVSRAFDAPTERAALPEGYPRTAEPAAPIGLVDQAGVVVSLADLEGRPAFMTFAFAHCRTVCPVVVRAVREAAGELPDVGPSVVVVTLDPWRDTPSSLPTLATSWQLDELPAAHVLSGEVDKVLAALEAWEMPIERNPLDGDIAHPALVYVLAADGTVAYTFNNPSSEWLVEAVRRL